MTLRESVGAPFPPYCREGTIPQRRTQTSCTTRCVSVGAGTPQATRWWVRVRPNSWETVIVVVESESERDHLHDAELHALAVGGNAGLPLLLRRVHPV